MPEIEDQNMHLTVLDEDGVERDCEIIMFYDCLENGIKYIFYTDNELDENGELNLYASRLLNLEGEDIKIGDIESEEEWALLDDVLEKAKEGFEG